MRLLLETIRIDSGGIRRLSSHNRRVNRARRHLYGCADELDLGAFVVPPATAAGGIIKCRVICGRTVERVEYQPYRPPVVRSLLAVRTDGLDYGFKYADRAALEALRLRRGTYDDVLIIRGDRVTDASFANVVFFDGRNYVTPDQPLLAGTRREELLEQGAIEAREIRLRDLSTYSIVFLVNSLIGLEDNVSLPVDCIGTDRLLPV
jgi:4-amino-4-deoxychorismate lyase